MRFAVVIALAVAALVLVRLKKEYRMHITAGFFLIIIVLNILHNVRTLNSIMPFIRPVNQLTYQAEYKDRMEFPDALIPLIVKDKTVYMKKDPAGNVNDVMARGFNWFYTFLHYKSTYYYLLGLGVNVNPDESMNGSVITNDMLTDFIDLGYGNDMYRNTSMYNGYPGEPMNYFGLYWYYGTMVAPMHIYVNTDGLYDADELVWLWQPISVTHDKEESEMEYECYDETEYMFIMSKDYYDSKF